VKIFTVTGKNNVSEDVLEVDLKTIKCFCGGRIELEAAPGEAYSKSYALTCKRCYGRYGAVATGEYKGAK